MPRGIPSKPTGRPLSHLPSTPPVSCVSVSHENCPPECLIMTSFTSGCQDCACPIADATRENVTEPFPTPTSFYAFVGERKKRRCIPSDELTCPPECIIVTAIDADCSDCACPLTLDSRRVTTATTTQAPFPTPPNFFRYIGECARANRLVFGLLAFLNAFRECFRRNTKKFCQSSTTQATNFIISFP